MMTAEDQLKEAKALRQKGRHAEALAMAQTVAAAYPDNADAWWVAGLAAHSLKKFLESLAALKETIRLAPRWAPGWAQYGIVLEENGQKPEGKKALYQAIKIKPDHVFAHRQLARIFKQEENFDGQILHLTRLDDLGEANGDDLNLLGIAHWRQKHFANAIEYYLRSAKLGAGPYPYFNLALVYSHPEVSQDVDAIDSLRRAIADTADYEPAIKKLGELTPRLFGLAQEVLKQGETLLHLGECFHFYLNPLEMVGFEREQDFEELDTKRIQRLKKAVLQEIDLEDGVIQSLDGFALDKSRAIGLCEELLDPKLRRYHWQVFKNPLLLWFMTRGDIRHFLHTENSFSLETLEALDEGEFRRWLSEPFARQYDLVLSRSNVAPCA
jgi:tetratricopeptide (TPR) repeat protein